MRAEVIPDGQRPGHAVLRLHDLDAPNGDVTLLVERRDKGSVQFLSERGWQSNETWLKPLRTQRIGEWLDLYVGPRVCDLVAGSNVRITLRDVMGRRLDATVVAWPHMQTSGAHDPDRRAADETPDTPDEETPTIVQPAAKVEVDQPTEPLIVQPVPEPPPPEPPPQPQPPPAPPLPPEAPAPNRWAAAVVLLSGLLVLVTVGAAYWLFLLNDGIDEARQARQQAIEERDACRTACSAPGAAGRIDAATRELQEKARALDAEIERLRRR